MEFKKKTGERFEWQNVWPITGMDSIQARYVRPCPKPSQCYRRPRTLNQLALLARRFYPPFAISSEAALNDSGMTASIQCPCHL